MEKHQKCIMLLPPCVIIGMELASKLIFPRSPRTLLPCCHNSFNHWLNIWCIWHTKLAILKDFQCHFFSMLCLEKAFRPYGKRSAAVGTLTLYFHIFTVIGCFTCHSDALLGGPWPIKFAVVSMGSRSSAVRASYLRLSPPWPLGF